MWLQVRHVLRTKAPPKLVLEIPAGVEPGKRFRTSFDGHAILTVTEIKPSPPPEDATPVEGKPLDPSVGGGAVLLEELCKLHTQSSRCLWCIHQPSGT